MGLSHYPPGHRSGNRRTEVERHCYNEDCPEFGAQVTVTLVYEGETGEAYIEPESDAYCPECEWDLGDA